MNIARSIPLLPLPEVNYAETRRWLAAATTQLKMARERQARWSWTARNHGLSPHQRTRCRRVAASLSDAARLAEQRCHELMTRFALDAARPADCLN